MRKRFRKHTDEDGSEHPGLLDRIPLWAVWLLLAVLVLGLVFNYDRSRQRDGRSRMETGRQMERDGMFDAAVEEYKAALNNKRLSADQCAEAAALLGDIYLTRFDDPALAREYYTRAKLLDASVLNLNGRKTRVDTATRRGMGSGKVRSGDTKTVINRVELLSGPAEDAQGDVVATFEGGELRHGEVARVMRERGLMEVTTNTAEYRAIVSELSDRALVYQAAVDAGLQRDPDVSRRLYEFQRTLLVDRYLANRRSAAREVTSDTIAAEMQKEAARLATPGQIGLAMIKLPSEEKANSVMGSLRNGNEFGAVAARDSIDTATKTARGLVGIIADNTDFIPGLGRQPELVKQLATLKKDDVTSPVVVNGAHYIFKIVQKLPPQTPSPETLQARIEATLRARQVKSTEVELQSGLRQRFGLNLLIPETTATASTTKRLEVVR